MRRCRRWLTTIWLTVGAGLVASGGETTLRDDLEAILGGEAGRGIVWGVSVRDGANGAELFAHQAERALIPASNQKLVTMAAALLALGPEFRSQTVFAADGPIVDGVLQGNLVVQGYGAIHFTARYRDELDLDARQMLLEEGLSRLVDELRLAGVQQVEGRLLADCSAYTDMPANLHYPCAAPLTFNENTLDVIVRDGQARTLPSHLVGFALREDTAVPAQHKGKASDLISVNPKQDSVDYWRLEKMAPEAYYLAHLERALTRRGLRFGGAVRQQGEAQPIVALRSLTVEELLPAMGITSDNFRAEMLYLNVVYARDGKANYATGPAVIADLFEEKGLKLPSCIAADGSGLSRDNRISAGDLVVLLQTLLAGQDAKLVRASLAVAGESGTLRDHLAVAALKGNLRGKSGTLYGVRALTGILTTRNGRELHLAIVGNEVENPAAWWQAVERVALRLYQE